MVGQLGHLVLGRINNRFGKRLNLVHEHLAAELAGLHLLEFVLPIAGQLGRAQSVDADVIQQINQREAFVGHHQIALLLFMSEHILVHD